MLRTITSTDATKPINTSTRNQRINHVRLRFRTVDPWHRPMHETSKAANLLAMNNIWRGGSKLTYQKSDMVAKLQQQRKNNKQQTTRTTQQQHNHKQSSTTTTTTQQQTTTINHVQQQQHNNNNTTINNVQQQQQKQKQHNNKQQQQQHMFAILSSEPPLHCLQERLRG